MVKLRTEILESHIVKRNISRNGFAIRAGIASGHLSQLLSGSRNPSGPTRQKLLRACGLEFDDLFVMQARNTSAKTDQLQRIPLGSKP